MAVGQNRLSWVMDLKIDQQSYNNMIAQLKQIQKMTMDDMSKNIGYDIGKLKNEDIVKYQKQLQEAQHSASQLEKIMHQAFNPKLNTVNLTQLKKEIDTLGGNNGLQKIASGLSQIGGQGSKVFHDFATQVFTTNVQIKEQNKLWKDLMVSMGNTAKWGVTSSIFNNITNSISQAWNYTKKLDTSLNDIRIVTGKSAEEMEKFALYANKAAQSLGKNTRDYTEASLIYYQQGLSEADVQSRTAATLKAANVTGQSTSAVSEQLTAVWNGYKVSAQEAELYVDKLAAVAATTAADLEELSVGMSKVASAANIMGVDIDELSAQMATIVSVTRQAPESVGTALKTIYARMGDIEAGLDSEISLGEYTSQMYAFGINVLDVDGHLRDMGEVITEVGEKWDKFTKEQQVGLSQVMAGTRQYNNLLSLFSNWDMYTDALEESKNAMGTLQEQQNIYMESTEAHLEKLSTAWERVFKSLTDKNGLVGVIDLLTLLTNGIANVTESLGGFWPVLALVTTTGIKKGSQTLGSWGAERALNRRKDEENDEMQRIKTGLAASFYNEHNKNASDEYLEEMAKATIEANKYMGLMSDTQQVEANNFVKRRAHLLQEKELIKLNVQEMQTYLDSLVRMDTAIDKALANDKTFMKNHSGYSKQALLSKRANADVANDDPLVTKQIMWDTQENMLQSWVDIRDDWTKAYAEFKKRSVKELAQWEQEYSIAENNRVNKKREYETASINAAIASYDIQSPNDKSSARLLVDIAKSAETDYKQSEQEIKTLLKRKETEAADRLKDITKVFDYYHNLASEIIRLAGENQILDIEEKTRADNAVKGARTAFSNSADNALSMLEDEDFEGIQAFEGAMTDLEDAMTRIFNTTRLQLQGIDKTLSKDLTTSIHAIDTSILDLNKEQTVFLEKFKLTEQIGSMWDFSAALMQAGAGVAALSNLPSIWNNENLSGAEKLFQLMTNLGMAIMMVKNNWGVLSSVKNSLKDLPKLVAFLPGAIATLSGYTKGMEALNPAAERQAAISIRMNQLWKQQAKTLAKLNEEEKENLRVKLLQQATNETDFLMANKEQVVLYKDLIGKNTMMAKATGLWGKAITAAGGSLATLVGWALAAVAVIAALGVGIYKLVKLYNQDADAAKEAAEAVKELKTAYDEAQESVNNFKGSLDNYKNAINNMKKLEKGTLEYKEAVLEANEKALALLETHEQLAQYARYDDGVITFNEEGMNKLLEQQILRSQYMQIDYLTGLIRSKEAQDQANITAFRRENKYNDVDGKAIYDTIKRDYEKYNGQVSEQELWSRSRQVRNADGSYSTVESFSTSDLKEGVEVLLSTVVKDATGQWVKITQDEAMEYYRNTNGANSLGEFTNATRATVFAEALHEAQDYYFKGALGEYKLMSQKVSEELIRDIANYMYDNNQTTLLEAELMNIESFADASMELKNSILWNIEEYEKMANSLNDSRHAQELFTKQAAASYLKMKGIVDDDGKMTVEDIIITNLFTQYQGAAPSKDSVEKRIREQSTNMPGLDSRDEGGQSDTGWYFYENEADAMREWYENTYGTTLKQSWWSKWFFGDKTYKKSAEFDIYDATGAKTDKKIKLEDIAKLYYKDQIQSETADQADAEAKVLAPKVQATANKAGGKYGDALAYILADSVNGEITKDNSLISQQGAQAILDNWEAIKQELDNSDIYKDLGFEAEADFLTGVEEFAKTRSKQSDVAALGADTIKTWNNHADTAISEALSGDLTSGNLTETFTMLVAEAEKLKSLYPELGVAVDTFTSKGLIGTEQWYQALYQIQDKLHELQEASVKEDFSNAYDDIQEKFKDNDQIDIKAWLDSDTFEDDLDNILDKDYAVNVEIHAQAEDYFDTFDTATDNLIEQAAKIGEGYIVAADDIRAVGNAFPGILNGMQKAEDGSVKLNRAMVKSATEAAKKELQISAKTTVDKLKDQATELRGKQAIYKGMYEAALALQKKDADVDAETKKIKEGFQQLENENDADSAEQKQDNQKAVANDSQEQGRVVAENWSEAYESAADSAIAFAKTAVSAHEAAESGDLNKIQKGDFNVNYTGRAAASSEGVKLAELKTDFENATSDEDYDKLAQAFKNAMDALGKQANDIESMAAGVSAQYLSAINSLNNIGAGKGKDGKDKSKEPDKAELEDKYDIYHDINIEIQQITNKLDELQEKEEEVFGTALIENLRDQIRKLDAQIKNYSQKLVIAQGEALGLATSLSNDYGFVFYEDGTVANYKEVYENEAKKIQAVYDKYSSMSADEQEKYEETKEAAEKRWDDFLEALERYDTLMTEEIPDILKSQREAENTKIEKQIQKFSMEVEIRLDLSEAEKDWNSFKKKMSEDDLLTAAKADLASLSTYYKENDKGLIQATTKHLNDVRAELITMDLTGSSSVYGNNRVKALEDLQKYYEQLMKDLENVNSIVDQIQQSYINMMKEANDAFSDQVGTYKQITNLLEHDMKIIKLINGEDSYAELDRYYEQLERNNRQQIDFQRQQVDFWKNEMDSLDPLEDEEAWKAAKNNWQNAVNDLNSQIESSIETLQDKYLNAIEKIFDDLNDKVTNGKGLEYVSEEWDLLGQNSDEFLDEINSLYGIEDIARKYQDAIDNTDNLTTQKKLKDVMEQELEALREKDKLTEYDIERAEKKYDLTLKQIALEEAQQNKSQLRLRRDSQGNYTYQYTADEDEVNKLEEELAATQNELYNFDLEQYKDKLSQLYDVYEEYQDKMKEAAQINDPDERAARELLLQQQYGELINGLVAQNEEIRNNLYESAFVELAALRNQELTDYTNLTQAEKDLLMNDLIPQWNSGIQEMADTFAGEGGFIPTCEEAMEELDDATREYEKELDRLEKTAEIDFEDIKDGIDDTADATRDLILDNEDLITSYENELTAIGNVLDELDDLIEKYEDAKTAAMEATEEAYKYWKTANEDAADKAGADKYNPIEKEPEMVKPESPKFEETKTEETKADADGVISVGDKVTFIGGSGRWYADSFGAGTSGTSSSDRQVTITRIASNPRASHPYHIDSLGWVKKSQLKGYDTGGYTGTWGEEGKLAFLHQKELVLNAQDTKNMLSAVDILRDITNSIGNTMLNRLAQLNTGAKGILTKFEGDTLEQNVHIDATFPNVQNSNEIEEALKNLTNRAAQRANRS